jgi:hypothetical protein
MTNAKKLLDSVFYPPNLDLGGDTLVQVPVIAGAVAESAKLLAEARACVKIDRLAEHVEGAGGQLVLSPEAARTFIDAEDEDVQALAWRALEEAVGDEAELAQEDISPAAGALVLVVGVLLHEAAAAAPEPS